MKIIISTKSLATTLGKFDLEINPVKYVIIFGNALRIVASTFQDVTVESKGDTPKEIKQHNVRWDWIKKLMNQVDEQPVTLNITESGVNVIFCY